MNILTFVHIFLCRLLLDNKSPDLFLIIAKCPSVVLQVPSWTSRVHAKEKRKSTGHPHLKCQQSKGTPQELIASKWQASEDI